MSDKLEVFRPCLNRPQLSSFSSKVSAGFPSPADDNLESFYLNSYLIKRPAATFFVRVNGDPILTLV